MDPQQWFVTARFIDTRHPLGREPLGVNHARRSGSDVAECGQRVGGWPIFWHLSFTKAPKSVACRDCAQAVAVSQRRHRVVA